jgi:hypothetical protein
MTFSDISELIPRSEIGRRLGLSAQRIDQLFRSGTLPYVQTALGRLAHPRDVERYHEQRAQLTQKRARGSHPGLG